MSSDCVFCDVVQKKIPSYLVYENTDVICFFPTKMEAYGHTIVAPKKHFVDIYDIPEDVLLSVLLAAQKLAAHYKEQINATGVNILHASGKGSQQSVKHFHLHLLPRFENDGLDAWPNLHQIDTPPEEIVRRIGVISEKEQERITMSDVFQYRFDLLKQEIDNLQTGIYSYDKILFTIKGWAITIFAGFITLAVQQTAPALLIFASIVIILFWILDALFKSIQRVYIRRYNQIEEYLCDERFVDAMNSQSFDDMIFPKIGASFRVSTKQKYIELIKAMFLLHTALLYVSMLGVIAMLVWFMLSAG